MRTALLLTLVFVIVTVVVADQKNPLFRHRSLQDNVCVVNGVTYNTFEQYPDPSCLPNVCSCRPGTGSNPCTTAACERDCGDKAVCTHDGQYYCAGDIFYDTACQPNTCRCADNGGVACTKMACFDECESDDDCTATVRSQTAQSELFPLCGCEARSTVAGIADKFEECLGEDDERACAVARCTNACEGRVATCTEEKKCELTEAPSDPAEEECTCVGVNDETFCPGESYTAPDGCNTCTCTGGPDGIAACTEMACPDGVPASSGTASEEPDEMAEGDTEAEPAAENITVAADDVPTTLPETDAAENITMAADDVPTTLPETDAACVVNGIEYAVGEKYVAADGCNSCTCSGDEDLAICTLMACPPCETTCEDSGQTYCAGVKFLSSDGCNECECTETGNATCTMMACPDTLETLPETTEVGNTTDEESGTPAALPNCGSFTSCLDCLNQEGCDAWSVGQCFPTCSDGPQDTSCYSQKYFSGTPDAICMQADYDKADDELCASMTDCTSCIDAVLSDGTSSCRWYAEGDGYCASGCGMDSCGATVCPDAKCSACEVLGINYCVGDVYVAEDGCNTCTCSSEDGLETCSLMMCEPCETCVVGDMKYCAAQQFLAADGCNICKCSQSGIVSCTRKACEEKPEAMTSGVSEEAMGDDSSSAITSSICVSVVLAVASVVGFALN